MKNFFWILTHYLKRNFLNLANYLVIGLPLIFSFAFQLVANFLIANNLDGSAFANLAIVIVLGFQFFGADLTTNWLHADLKGSTRLRLHASGNDQRVFYLAVVIAGWLFNTLMGAVLVAITSLIAFFNADWGNYILIMLAILLLSFLTQLVGVLIFYTTKDKKAGAKVAYLFGEAMIGIAIFPAMFNLSNTIKNITNYLPAELGVHITTATTFASARQQLAILFGMNILLATCIFLIGRRRNNDNL